MLRPSLITFWASVICGSLLAPGITKGATGTSLGLVPCPRVERVRSGSVRLSGAWQIVARADSADLYAAALLSGEGLACFGWTWPVVSERSAASSIELRSIPPSPAESHLFNEQGYRLTILPRSITVEAASAQGRYYGVQTLRQILRASRDGAVPRVAISDYPALAWRGISDDISRGQVSTQADFRATIRKLGYYKINLYQPYVENVFAFGEARGQSPPPGAVTRAELAEMVAEGRRNHVTVSPIFETLAHQERLLRRPGLRNVSARTGGSGPDPDSRSAWARLAQLVNTIGRMLVLPWNLEQAQPGAFSTENPQALAAVEALLDEIADLTPDPFVHIGGDEWDDQYEGGSQADSARGEAGRRFGRYVGALCEHIRLRYGRQTMLYGDVLLRHPEAASALPRDAAIVDWHYDPADSFPSLDQLRRLGFGQIIVSPGLWTWRTFYPNFARGVRSVSAFADAGKRAGAIGCIAAAWGDDGAENLRENNWLGYAFAAAASWERQSPSAGSFPARFVAVHYGVASPQLAEAELKLGWQEFEGVGWSGRLYHRPPLVRQRPSAWLQRMRDLDADMAQVEQDLQQPRPDVRFDRDHLDAMALCAGRFRYIAERELFLDQAARVIGAQGPVQSSHVGQAELADGLARLEAKTTALQAKFGELWLRRNRPEGLAENLVRMRRQTVMLDRLLQRARAGRLAVDSTYSGMQALARGL
jgi:hexosaminidase